jgi:hypothetical protein
MEKHHVSNVATENAWFLSIFYVFQEMVPSSQQPPEGGCWAPFSCSWGTEGGPLGPRPGARHTLQHGRPPSSGSSWALLFPSRRLAGSHKQLVPRSRGKIVLALENSWAVPVKALYSHRSTTLRCVFFLTALLQHEKRNCCSTATHRNYQETCCKCIVI